MPRKKKITSYQSAMEELTTIVTAIESQSVSVDQLGDYTTRANELVQYCQTKLRATEEQVQQNFDKLES